MSTLDEQQQAKEAEVAAYRKLQTLGMTEEFKEYSDMLVKTVAGKMIFAFTSNTIKDYEDFCRIRGEVVARLQPIQAVHEAGALAATIENEIKEFYLPKS